MSDDKIYRTSDLPEAAFLKCAEFDIVDYKMDNGKIYFLFNDTEELQKSRIEYINGKCRVEPRQYQSELDGLKSIVKQLKSK